jgi:hypothetical protein
VNLNPLSRSAPSRTPRNPLDAITRSCVRFVCSFLAFSSICRLPSVPSAGFTLCSGPSQVSGSLLSCGPIRNWSLCIRCSTTARPCGGKQPGKQPPRRITSCPTAPDQGVIQIVMKLLKSSMRMDTCCRPVMDTAVGPEAFNWRLIWVTPATRPGAAAS